MNSFDYVTRVTDKVVPNAGFREDSGRKEVLKTSCERIDRFAERFDGVLCKATADVDDDEICVSLVCSEFQIEDRLDEFYILLMGTKRVDIKKYDEDLLQIDFVFGGIWVERQTETGE